MTVASGTYAASLKCTYKRSSTRAVRYATREAAEQGQTYLARTYPAVARAVGPYSCPGCHGWHLGTEGRAR